MDTERHFNGIAFDLCRPVRGGISAYLLLDLTRPLDAHWRQQASKRATPIPDDRFSAPPLALLRLDGHEDPLIPESLERALAVMGGSESAVCGWLFIPDTEDLALLAARLGRFLSLKAPDGARMLLRWYDPRVLPHLPGLFGPALWQRFRRGIRHWAHIGWHGELCWLPEGDPAGDGAFAPLRLDPERYARARRLGSVNPALSLHAARDGRVDTDTLGLADALVARFDAEYGTGDARDGTLFALHGLRIHPRFDAHPEVARALRAMREGDRSLAQALNAFDASAWTRIAAELAATPIPDAAQGSRE